MIQFVSKSTFRDAIKSINPQAFSYDGLGKLYDHLNGDDYLFYPQDVCCSYTEYRDIDEFNFTYNTEHRDFEDIDDTTVIYIGDGRFIAKEF